MFFNNLLKSIGSKNVNIGSFTEYPEIDYYCRMAGTVEPPDNMTFAAYIEKAFIDELKTTGIYNETAQPVITGKIHALAFSSRKVTGGGTWDIVIELISSNGKTMTCSEHYEFEVGFNPVTACKQVAEAFPSAVQKLIGKVIKAPEFKGLIQ